MTLPIKTNKEDIDEIVAYLKKKPVGITVDDAKATVDSRLLDGRKLNAYRTWGFVTDNGNKLILTPLGREYAQASEDDKRGIYANIIEDVNIYRLTTEWLHNRGFDQIPVSDLATHWYEHFKTEIGTDTEDSLNNQVMSYMNIAAAAGFGEYKMGRRGQPTRLEINQSNIKAFIEKSHADLSSESSIDPEPAAATPNVSGSADNKPIADREPMTPPPTLPTQIAPSLHIDIQIHIASDASPDQIEQIFASMGKHLYRNTKE